VLLENILPLGYPYVIHMTETHIPVGQKPQILLEGIPFENKAICPDQVILLSSLFSYLQVNAIQGLTEIQQKMLLPFAVHTALESQESLGAGAKTRIQQKFLEARNGQTDVQITRPQFERAFRRLQALDPNKEKKYIQEQLSWFDQYSAKMKSKTFVRH
jgi:hypothetical protein